MSNRRAGFRLRLQWREKENQNGEVRERPVKEKTSKK